MPVEQRPIVDIAQWKAWRREVVTASQVGALFGLHPYTTALALYASMRGVEFEDIDDKVLRRGRWLESSFPAVVAEIEPRYSLTANKMFFVDKSLGLGATPDFTCQDAERPGLVGVLQSKTAARHIFERDWQGGETIPAWIVLQCLAEQILVGADFGLVACLVVDPFAMSCVVQEVPRHPAAEAKLLAAVRTFVDDVMEGNEPAVDFERDGATLRLLLPKERPGSELDLGGDIGVPTMLETRAELLASMKKMKLECEVIENKLRLIMGDYERATGVDGFSVTCRTTKRKAYSVPASETRVLRIRDLRPKEERPDGDDDESE
jgi:hypothetical protein